MVKKSLCDLTVGEKTVVKKVEMVDKKICARLIEMGFVKNQKIDVVKNFKKTKTMVVIIRGCVLALDYNLAKSIMVY